MMANSHVSIGGYIGGQGGKGGDFIYRWGNPQNYQRDDFAARQLFGQHDVRWIKKRLPGAENLTVFNNHPPDDPNENIMNSDGYSYLDVYEFTRPIYKNRSYIIEKDKPQAVSNIFMSLVQVAIC